MPNCTLYRTVRTGTWYQYLCAIRFASAPPAEPNRTVEPICLRYRGRCRYLRTREPASRVVSIGCSTRTASISSLWAGQRFVALDLRWEPLSETRRRLLDSLKPEPNSPIFNICCIVVALPSRKETDLKQLCYWSCWCVSYAAKFAADHVREGSFVSICVATVLDYYTVPVP